MYNAHEAVHVCQQFETIDSMCIIWHRLGHYFNRQLSSPEGVGWGMHVWSHSCGAYWSYCIVIVIVNITIIFTIDYVNNTIWTPTVRDDFSCNPLRMYPTEGSTRYDRASRSVIRLRFHTSLDQNRFLLHVRKEKPNCHRDKNGILF